MADAGWLKLYRKMRDHWLWKIKPFSPGHAWIDLLLRVNFSERPIPRPGAIGPRMLQPGKAIVSIRGLAVNWGWSRGKTQRFLRCLRNESMIETTNETTYTLLNLLNWKKYQPLDEKGEAIHETMSGTMNGPATGPLTGHQRASDGAHQEKVEKDEKGEKARTARTLKIAPPSAAGQALAKQYLKMNPGVINERKASQWFDFALARGAPEGVLMDVLQDPTATKGRKVWEVFEPLCPPPSNGESSRSWIDDMMTELEREEKM